MLHSFITAENFPYEYINLPTPRGIGNIYLIPKKYKKPCKYCLSKLTKNSKKLRNTYIFKDTGKKTTKSWLLDSEEKCLIQTAFSELCLARLRTKKNIIRKTLILYEKG